MAKWKATSSADKAKVIKELVTNPDASLRDVERTTWVHNSTVRLIKQNDAPEIAEKSQIVADIVSMDKEIIHIANELSLSKFKHLDFNELKLNDIKIVSEIADKSTKRVATFWWDITDKDWWLKQQDVVFQIINPNGQ